MPSPTNSRPLMQFVLLEGIHPNAVDLLRSSGLGDVVQDAHALQGAELARALAGAHVLGLRSRTQLTADVLAQAPKLLAVGAFCIGTDQIDLQAAALHGVPVFNAPFSNTRSVAELVLAEVVLLLRGI
ncbi:MAG TPA: phosphoglycerate dehydrogenase, partial [Rubrivivax sp.]|nr:phosphoglycerate dehydrogenase [Rubrivivax sp.]